MRELEQLLGLFLAAVLLAAAARRVGAPYPVFLAVGGAALAFVPGVPSFAVHPELALALFVAPVLLDAAFDASPRDLRDNWAPVTGLAVVAVGVTTAAVAVVVSMLDTGDAVGAGDCSRRGRRSPRRRSGDRRAPPAAATPSSADHSRRRKPPE